MSTRLVLLGLLKDRPLYGYELKHIIEEHMGDWTSIAFGSIYFGLSNLRKEKLVEVAAEEQEGNRPSRRVYRITEAGKEEFFRLLRKQWKDAEWRTFDFDIGLFFSRDLPVKERIRLTEEKITALESIQNHITSHKKATLNLPEVPLIAEAIFDHSIVHAEAELTWLKNLLQSLKNERQ